MAKYTVTYKCGHTAEVNLVGKESDRQRKIAWYATIDCPECEGKAQKAIAEAAGLPALSGSEKQVAWATKLRNSALTILDGAISRAPERNREILDGLRAGWLAKETASTYWIDNRFELDEIRDILALVQKSTNYTPSK